MPRRLLAERGRGQQRVSQLQRSQHKVRILNVSERQQTLQREQARVTCIMRGCRSDWALALCQAGTYGP